MTTCGCMQNTGLYKYKMSRLQKRFTQQWYWPKFTVHKFQSLNCYSCSLDVWLSCVMTEVLSDSNFLPPATSRVKRTSSEPDFSGGGFRQRTCSNSSQLKYNRTRETSIVSGGSNKLSRSPSPTASSTDADDEMLADGTGRYGSIEMSNILWSHVKPISFACQRNTRFSLI